MAAIGSSAAAEAAARCEPCAGPGTAPRPSRRGEGERRSRSDSAFGRRGTLHRPRQLVFCHKPSRSLVIPVLVTGIHRAQALAFADGWMPGTSPGMTTGFVLFGTLSDIGPGPIRIIGSHT